MDMRAFSKGYQQYYQRAQDKYGIQYHRSRISEIHENPATHNLSFIYTNDEGDQLERIRAEFDLVILSVGMEISESVQGLGRQLGIELDDYGFCRTVQFNPVESSRRGIYAVGPFREPKDITESVVEASSAAGAIGSILGQSRFSLTTTKEYPPEKDVSLEEPKVGVFVCHCGTNIGGYLDVPSVTEYAASLPHVVYAEDNLYTCSQDSIKHITDIAIAKGLNRVVVASCSTLTHQPLFRDCIREAGLNPFLFEMANIRNQCSWVHSNDNPKATAKAKDLVRMSVARAALLTPQKTFDVPIDKHGLVVGGGAAGMTAALTLAESGFPVHLVEKNPELGGQLRHIFTPLNGKDPQEILNELVRRVDSNQKITVHLNSQVSDTTGFKGNFSSTIKDGNNREEIIEHGVVILATGGEEYKGPEYGYGSDPRIVTQQTFEEIITGHQNSPLDKELDSIVMIQCVGPAEKYCARICCTVALKNALAIKKQKPDTQVTIIYKDIRDYGFKERLYAEAREQGVIFIRYDKDHKPDVIVSQPSDSKKDSLTVLTWDKPLHQTVEIHPDLVVLSMPVIPNPDTKDLANQFKVSIDNEGFFMEAHVKLRPIDFATEGLFMAGMAHYPKLIDESMIQAQAAASRAFRVLSQDSLLAGGRVAVVEPEKCTGCLTCLRVCPFEVPIIKPDLAGAGEILGAAYIEPAVCQGCGICSAECPAKAIQLMHFTDAQMIAKVRALVQLEPVPVPLMDS